MNVRYRLVLFSKTIYKEIDLSDDCKRLSIGTFYENEIRLKKELFFENFSLVLTNRDDIWEMECSSNIYISYDDIRKMIRVTLKHGDEYGLRYQNAEGDFLRVSFLIDFDYQDKKYEDIIPLIDHRNISIGSDSMTAITLKNPYVQTDYVVLGYDGKKLTLDIQDTTYGVCVNGMKVDKSAVLKNGDFFSIARYYFYYDNGYLYTDLDESIILNGINSYRKSLNSCFDYPRFHRNTRRQTLIPNSPIPVLDPPEKPEKPKNNLLMSVMPSVVMLILTIVIRGFMSNTSSNTFVIFSACTIGLGIVTSIITYIQGKKEYKLSIREREKNYRAYAEQKSKDIALCRDKEREILNHIYLDLEHVAEHVDTFSGDLFDRTPKDEDFLYVRLGTGKTEAVRQIDYKLQEKFVTDDEIVYIPERLMETYYYLEDSPIVLGLREANAVGFVGKSSVLNDIVPNIVMDLAGRQYKDDVHFVFIMNKHQLEEFDWIRFLPHVQTEGNYIRSIGCNTESRTNIFESLYKELSYRMENQKQSTDGEVFQHLLIFVLDSGNLMTHPLSRFIPVASSIEATFLFFEEHKELLPMGCTSLVYMSKLKGELVDVFNDNVHAAFTYSPIEKDQVRNMAMRLAPIYCEEVNLEGNLVKNISLFELLKIYCVEDLDLTKRWEEAETHRSLAAPLGVKTKNEVINLDIHEKAHGPHGLVAGTTGSGKSEILQSYILSMATMYHPYEVGFVIIDFKGGGMANQFLDLPHLIGTITNIDGKQISRSLLSIKAELIKRQNYFADAEVNHIDKYIMRYKKGEVDKPLPHLIIIVDEFAELRAEYPDFMKELISAARIGRSLGVHLILATQKPSGQVNEQIWSNSRFKLCLKVQSPEDSNEMIKSPLAAEILEPGRAYFQVGNNEIFELFQSGYSGAPEKMSSDTVVSREYKIHEVSLEGKRKCVYEQKRVGEVTNQRTQLEAVVSYVKGYCEEKEIQRLENICLPPLPELLAYPSESHKSNGVETIVEIGLLDDPGKQTQRITTLNLSQDNVIIVGASQYGKTNLLQTIVRGLADAYTPEEVNIYILDFGSMILRNFDDLRHVGGVVTLSEDEKFKNLMKFLLGEIAERKEKLMKAGVSSFVSYREAGKTDMPQIILMVDNFTAVKETYLQEEDFIMQICREGLAVGISVIICNTQTAGMGYRYMANLAKRIVFYCNEAGEYSNVIERCRIEPDNVAGRALTEINKEIFEFQSYLSFEGEREIERVSHMQAFVKMCNSKNSGQAKRIPEIPEILEELQFEKDFGVKRNNSYTVPIGLYYESISVMEIDLLNQGWFAISGRDGMGKKNLLRLIFNQLYSNLFTCPSEVYIVDNVERKLDYIKDSGIVAEYSIDASDLLTFVDCIYTEIVQRYQAVSSGEMKLTEEPLKLVIVQNQDAIEELCKNTSALKQYKELTGRFKIMKVCFVFMDITNAVVNYNAPEIMKSIKENKNLFFFDELKNLKLCDVSAVTLRSFKKQLTLGDCYWMSDNEIYKIKTVKGKRGV